jgi:hypothetical protein
MKRSIVFCLLIFCATVCTAQSKDLKKLQWLEGEWNRTNAKPGRSGIEKWKMNSSTEMQGWGISMRGTDTSFVEKLKIVVKDNNIYYVADVPENKAVVLFKLTKSNDNEFVFENPEHDFPKQITYTRDGNKLKATVSGNGKTIEYLFEKKL